MYTFQLWPSPGNSSPWTKAWETLTWSVNMFWCVAKLRMVRNSVQGWKRCRNRWHRLHLFGACVALAQLGVLYTYRIPPLFALSCNGNGVWKHGLEGYAEHPDARCGGVTIEVRTFNETITKWSVLDQAVFTGQLSDGSAAKRHSNSCVGAEESRLHAIVRSLPRVSSEAHG